MEINKEEAERYLHVNFVKCIDTVRIEPHRADETERQMEQLWGALGVFKNFGVLSVAECQSILNQVGSSSEASNL